MPYITCKDGKSYSTYDNSEYVHNCISLKKQKITYQWTACNNSKDCVESRDVDAFVLCGIFLVILITTAIMAYKFLKIFKDIDASYRQQ